MKAEEIKREAIPPAPGGKDKEAVTNPIPKDEEKLHKQPRSYLKTSARLVGRSTDEKTLFSMPEATIVKIDGRGDGRNLLREVISRNTTILGNYLFQLFEEGGGKELIIDKLGPLAEMMSVTNSEVKIYLLYLGGYTYPIVTKNEDGGLTLASEQMFTIKFNYSKAVADRYKDTVPIVGTSLAWFVKNEPVDTITVRPNPIFIKALEGKGLGNVLVANDRFVKLALSLETDIAYKILSYSASNKPSQKIAENNLVKHLGLDKQIKTQGRPRIRATIMKGLKELQDKGHIKNYSFNEAKGMYSLTYSNRYIKHSLLRKDKTPFEDYDGV